MTRYYGVVGNRDDIKRADGRHPFWEFLDEQPEGWLCSLAYPRTDVPANGPRLWDCGAWSYRDLEVPKLKRNLVTATWAMEQYLHLANPGDFVVAPDHMLIPDKDLESRRRFNRESAEAFITLAHGAGLEPMAGVHGATPGERIEHARWLQSIGYANLALGGLAAGRASQKVMVIGVVSALREALPGAWLHVLGLSAPDYYAAWRRLGIQSCDGASQFKQAFSGAFFIEADGKLVKHQAAKPQQPPMAPQCECLACATLREDGVDTRTYGSNQHNMGRAAHNLNMLMRAHGHIRQRRLEPDEPPLDVPSIEQLVLIGDE